MTLRIRALLRALVISLASCVSGPGDAVCELSDEEFGVLNQRVKEFLNDKHPSFDTDCDTFANSTIYTKNDGCLILESWQRPESCPDILGSSFVVAFERETLTPTALLTTPDQ